MSNRDLPRIRRYHGSTGIERPRVCAGTAYIDNCILDCARDCFGPARPRSCSRKCFPLKEQFTFGTGYLIVPIVVGGATISCGCRVFREGIRAGGTVHANGWKEKSNMEAVL